MARVSLSLFSLCIISLYSILLFNEKKIKKLLNFKVKNVTLPRDVTKRRMKKTIISFSFDINNFCCLSIFYRHTFYSEILFLYFLNYKKKKINKSSVNKKKMKKFRLSRKEKYKIQQTKKIVIGQVFFILYFTSLI